MKRTYALIATTLSLFQACASVLTDAWRFMSERALPACRQGHREDGCGRQDLTAKFEGAQMNSFKMQNGAKIIAQLA